MIIGLISVKRIIDKVDEKKVNIIAIIVTILFFILMSVFGNIYKSEPTYDLSDVIREANAMLENNGQFQDEFGYFKSCTNQIPLAIMVYLIFKLGSILGFGGNSLMGFATVINSLFIAITAFFTPGFQINNIWALAIATVVLTAIDYLIIKFTGLHASPFGKGFVGFALAAVVLYVTQFFVAGYSISWMAAIIGALIYGVVDYFLPGNSEM